MIPIRTTVWTCGRAGGGEGERDGEDVAERRRRGPAELVKFLACVDELVKFLLTGLTGLGRRRAEVAQARRPAPAITKLVKFDHKGSRDEQKLVKLDCIAADDDAESVKLERKLVKR